MSRKERSSKEIESHLIKIGVSESLIPKYIQALIDDGLLSDVRFVEEKVRVRLFRNAWGPIKIKEELQIHQIDRELVRTYLSTVDASEWEKACLSKAKKYKSRKKDFRYIQNRLLENGFEEPMINKILKSLGFFQEPTGA